jgi:hypothetical protein
LRRTKLHDAIPAGGRGARSGSGNKRLIVVSDGKDEGSTLTADKLVNVALATPVVRIDAVAFGVIPRSSSGSLSTIAGATGRFVQPGASALEDALRQLIADVSGGRMYIAAFVYTPSPDQRTSETASLVYGQMARPRSGASSISRGYASRIAGAHPRPDRSWTVKIEVALTG